MTQVFRQLALSIFSLALSSSVDSVPEKPPDRGDPARIILHRKGKETAFDPKSSSFDATREEAEKLFSQSDGSFRLIVTQDLITRLKSTEAILQVRYEKAQSATISFNQQKVYFIELWLPLTGRFSNGTVFFTGGYAFALGGTTPTSEQLAKAGPSGAVVNSKGIGKLKELLVNAGFRLE